MADTNITKLVLKSYLAAIRNSVGSNTWRNFYAVDNGIERDVLNDGDVSCAYFVSSITTMFGFSKSIHMTVGSTIKDLEESGWVNIDRPRDGAILLWEPQDFGEEGSFTHIGFYVGNERAISTSLRTHTPTEYDWHFRDYPPEGKTARQVEKILWHKKLA